MFGFSSLFKRNMFSETTPWARERHLIQVKAIWWSPPRIWNWDRDASFCVWLELRRIKQRLRRHPMQWEMEKAQQSEKKRSQGLGERTARKIHFQAFVGPFPHESFFPWILRWPWRWIFIIFSFQLSTSPSKKPLTTSPKWSQSRSARFSRNFRVRASPFLSLCSVAKAQPVGHSLPGLQSP